MSQTTTPSTIEQSSDGSQRFPVWALVPVALLAGSLTLIGVMVSIATSDPGFAVEANYYQKAVDWDAQRAQQAESSQLSWAVQWRFEPDATSQRLEGRVRVVVEMMDRNGVAIENAQLQATAFANARAARVESLDFRETTPGTYEASLELHRAGLWKFHLVARHDGHTFSDRIEPEFPSTRLTQPLRME